MKPLYELVTARAAQTWTDPINSTNYNLYAAHWIETAIKLADEFKKHDLNDTAIRLLAIAQQQERFT